MNKDSLAYKVAEAIITHPVETFTVRDIYDSLNDSTINLNSLSALMTVSDGIILTLVDKSIINGRAVFTRKPDAKMPAADVPSRRIPMDEVTDTQIGRSIIYYIEKLKEENRELEQRIESQKSAYCNEVRVLRQELEACRIQLKKFKEANETLRDKKTFKMSEVARWTHTKR